MGHREDLLEGAKRCLLVKGFLRTTARDIVKESGTNLASIGYHYGSKDALLVQAYVALIEATGHRFEPGGEGEGAPATPTGSLERFRQVWTSITSAVGEARAIWMLSFEVVVQGERLAEIRQMLVEAEEQGRSGLLPLFNDIPEEEQDKETVDTEGRFYQTLLQGLMVQWVFNPDTATDADQLTEGLRRVTEGFSRS
ncbi:AcrR family transcriptional regulator [Streptomyces canus]|uniref:TetR/AcrR family transcriptional regulator n=1 Tax=Streptomyces canus TaxID=58343 RepID=UPI002783D90A|nr:TetR/AcrR family transcriptional regulator [Streptomyces canus]MDQ0598719.1 AcrR family transcriptional regulator [Streptomyces canus]